MKNIFPTVRSMFEAYLKGIRPEGHEIPDIVLKEIEEVYYAGFCQCFFTVYGPGMLGLNVLQQERYFEQLKKELADAAKTFSERE